MVRTGSQLCFCRYQAPMVAKKAEPGQFIILRVDENGERIPNTIHDFDREKGTVTIIVQTIGATTEKLRHKAEGEYIQDFVGPLRPPTETEGKQKVRVGAGIPNSLRISVPRNICNLKTAAQLRLRRVFLVTLSVPHN